MHIRDNNAYENAENTLGYIAIRTHSHTLYAPHHSSHPSSSWSSEFGATAGVIINDGFSYLPEPFSSSFSVPVR